MTVLAGVMLNAIVGQQRREQLIAEIRQFGGGVAPGDQVWERLQKLFTGERPNGTGVLLRGHNFRSGWVAAVNDCDRLEIEHLEMLGTSIPDQDIARLIDRQPLRSFRVEGQAIGERALAALGQKRGIEFLSLPGTRLADESLRALALEDVIFLNVSNTDVTPEGLQELNRCPRLGSIVLDGSQLTDETVELLASLGYLTYVELHGPEVSDRHLLALQALKSLRMVQLVNTSVSDDALKSALLRTNVRRVTMDDVGNMIPVP